MSYGLIENAPLVRSADLLPMGLSPGCRLIRDIHRDEPISYSDVQLPAGRLSDQLLRRTKSALRHTQQIEFVGLQFIGNRQPNRIATRPRFSVTIHQTPDHHPPYT